MMRLSFVVALIAVLTVGGVGEAQRATREAADARAASRPSIRFEITVPPSVRPEPITGRVYVMITRNADREPRLQLNQADGIPFFGRDVERLAPGAAAVVDDTDLGFPVDSLRDIPPGEYSVQAFVNVYSEFKRADGHVVWMHD